MKRFVWIFLAGLAFFFVLSKCTGDDAPPQSGNSYTPELSDVSPTPSLLWEPTAAEREFGAAARRAGFYEGYGWRTIISGGSTACRALRNGKVPETPDERTISRLAQEYLCPEVPIPTPTPVAP